MSGAAEELRARVAEAARGTPYVVAATDDGFDVRVDLADQRWRATGGEAGVSRTCVHHVRVNDGRYTIVDDLCEVRWQSGVPTLGLGVERVRGRVITFGRTRVWGQGPDGRPTRLTDLRFDSEEGRELVTAAADGLGLRLRRSTTERVGLAVGVVAAVGAALTVAVLLVAWAAGAFG